MKKEEIQKNFQISSGIRDFADEESGFHKENNPSFKEEFIETWVNIKKVELLDEIINDVLTIEITVGEDIEQGDIRGKMDWNSGRITAMKQILSKLTTTKEQLLNVN